MVRILRMLLVASTLCGCTDLSAGSLGAADADMAGSEGAAATGGDLTSAGGTLASGGEVTITGGTTVTGGDLTSSGGTLASGGDVTATGGISETGGAPMTGGIAASGGDMAGTGGTVAVAGDVTGTVVDTYGSPVYRAKVHVESLLTETDERGKFSLPNVAATYNLQVTTTSSTLPGTAQEPAEHTWIYEALTRRDPTLQVVEHGVYNVNSVIFDIQAPASPAPYTKYAAAYGANYGSFELNSIPTGSTTFAAG